MGHDPSVVLMGGRALVLGGAGAMGREAVRDLALTSDFDEIVVADREVPSALRGGNLLAQLAIGLMDSGRDDDAGSDSDDSGLTWHAVDLTALN